MKAYNFVLYTERVHVSGKNSLYFSSTEGCRPLRLKTTLLIGCNRLEPHRME